MSDVAGPKPAPGPDQPPIPVRLVTLTTPPGTRHDLPRLARLLAGAEADIVCLQGVDRSEVGGEDVDPALLLSRTLDMQLAWEPVVDEPRGDGTSRRHGHVLLSRLPVLVSSVHRLPGGGVPGGVLQTMVELDGGALWVTATHLTTGSAQERAEQVAALAGLHSEPMETGVVVGDLDAAPDAPELAALRERFADAWDLAPERADRARPRRRIDQVWVSPGVQVTAARALDGDGASDHLPLVVDLAVRSGV